MKLAALELSARKIRLLVADGARLLDRREVATPPIESIGPAERKALVQLLEELRGHALAAGAHRIVAIATGSLRRARGISALQAVLPGRLGFELLLPSAIEERRLVYQGVVGERTGRLGVIHLAESWADFVVGEGRTLLFEQSLPLGLGFLERGLEHQAATPGEHAARLVDAIAALSEPVTRELRAHEPREIVFAADASSAAAGVVLGVLASLVGPEGTRHLHRPLAEGLLACELAAAQAEADSADRDQEIRVPDLAAET